jgi:hypothetical protein
MYVEVVEIYWFSVYLTFGNCLVEFAQWKLLPTEWMDDLFFKETHDDLRNFLLFSWRQSLHPYSETMTL